MQLSHAITGLEDAVETQLGLAGPEAAAIGSQFMAALKPAIRQTLMDIVTMASAEVSSQLPGYRVEVRIIDGDPELVVSADSPPPPPPPPPGVEDDEARITLRLPSYLKDLIAEAANTSGDSVNAYVVDALKSRTHTRKGVTRHKGTIEL